VRAFAIFVLSLTSSCLCGISGPPSTLNSGTYVAQSFSLLPGATLVFDTAAKSGTLTPPGGAAIALGLAAVPEADWPTGCPTNTRVTVLEAYTLTPAPLDAGTVFWLAPRLTAGCGVDGAKPGQVVIESTMGGAQGTSFDRIP